MKQSGVLLAFASATSTAFAATCGIWGGNGEPFKYESQLYSLRQDLCGSSEYANCENTTTDSFRMAYGCVVQDSSDNFVQAMSYGPSPQGQYCWDGFDDIYNECIKNNWLSGLYSWNGNVYLMTLEGYQN